MGRITIGEAGNEVVTTAAADDNIYLVLVRFGDGGADPGEHIFKVTVTNVEELGEVRLSQLQPQMDVEITARVIDPDGNAAGIDWQWGTSSRANGVPTPIAGATSETYTPRDEDVGQFLFATAIYLDPHGNNDDEETSTAMYRVRTTPAVNTLPMFPDQNPADITNDGNENTPGSDFTTTVRWVAEHSMPGTPVGSARDGHRRRQGRPDLQAGGP